MHRSTRSRGGECAPASHSRACRVSPSYPACRQRALTCMDLTPAMPAPVCTRRPGPIFRRWGSPSPLRRLTSLTYLQHQTAPEPDMDTSQRITYGSDEVAAAAKDAVRVVVVVASDCEAGVMCIQQQQQQQQQQQ